MIIDSAEQPIEKPTDYQEQKIYYSGKQKRHTLKSQFIVLPKAEDVVDVVIGQPDPTSDLTKAEGGRQEGVFVTRI